MTKEAQEKYITENVGYIIQEYNTKRKKNSLVLLMEEGIIVVNLPEFLKGTNPRHRSKYKRYFKELIRNEIIPVISMTKENKLLIYKLKRESGNTK